MTDEFNLVISHVSLGTNRFEDAVRFNDSLLPTLGCSKVMEYPGATAYGKHDLPIFWIQAPYNGEAAKVGNGTHVAFNAASKQAVHDFYNAAIAAGATPDGEPGPREDYGPAYYGCFVRDLDGHKIEATFWDTSQAEG